MYDIEVINYGVCGICSYHCSLSAKQHKAATEVQQGQ